MIKERMDALRKSLHGNEKTEKWDFMRNIPDDDPTANRLGFWSVATQEIENRPEYCQVFVITVAYDDAGLYLPNYSAFYAKRKK